MEITMKIAASKYVRPTADEKPNEYIPLVKQFTDQGIDTAFEITTTAGEYAADKLLIQKAVNAHGFSARVVVAPEIDDETDEKASVKATFVVRPARKPREPREKAQPEG